MTTLANTTDHAAQMLDNLATQFKDSTHWQALLNVLGSEIQAVEDALYGVLVTRVIATATGNALDGLGDILGVSRGTVSGLSDADFRLVLTAQIIAIANSGEPEAMLRIVDTIITEWSADTDTVFADMVAGFRILNLTDITTEAKVRRAWRLLNTAAGAAIQPAIHYTLSAASGLFRFAPNTTLATSVTYGFGHGKFASAQTEVPDDEV